MKKISVVLAICCCFLIAGSAAALKPGDMVKLTLINKMVNQPGYISLSGKTNYYSYFLTAHAYEIEKMAEGKDMNFLDDGKAKALITTYEVRKDRYEGTIISCGSVNSGVFDLTRETTIVFPPCERGTYGKQYTIEPKSKCIFNPILPECKKEGFILTIKGGKGESNQIKVRKPPVVDELDVMH